MANKDFIPPQSIKDDRDVLSLGKWNGWGSYDKYFDLNQAGNVALSTTSEERPGLLPYIKTHIPNLTRTPSVRLEEIQLEPPILNEAFISDIKRSLEPHQFTSDHAHRVTHCYGKSCRDLWLIRQGKIARAPDAIIYPQNHTDVEKIVKLANDHNVILIPFGGGTNVVGATEPEKGISRMIVTLDLRRMNRILWVDRTSMQACIEVGITGPELEQRLGREGLALGHDPDSFEQSTLGGWLGARSSGMQSDRYGDIEEMTISLKLVTPGMGTIVTPPVPRAATGPDLNHVIVGSEGTLGVITEAIMKVHPLPDVRSFQGILFPSFDAGLKVIRECWETGLLPAMSRLYDPEETRLSFAMKPHNSFLQNMVSSLIKKYLEMVKSFDLNTICLGIIGFFGTKSHVDFLQKQVFSICSKYGAFVAGPSAGESWYQKRYDLPLIRDFMLNWGLWVEVAETSTTWDNALKLWKNVKKAMEDAFKEANIPLWIVTHVSHSYRSGVCLYFHFATSQDDGTAYNLAKLTVTQAILLNKGSLSHHHGIGMDHRTFMPHYLPPANLLLLEKLKISFDPKNILNPGKLLPSRPEHGDPVNSEKDYPFNALRVWNATSSVPLSLHAKL